MLLGSVLLTQTGCFGSFGLVKKVYEFNKGLGNKFVQEVVFIVLTIIPVYEIAGVLDLFILNLIEFWTGSNPMAMAPGEQEIKMVKGKDGLDYQLTVSYARMDVKCLTDENRNLSMSFDTKANAWQFENAKGEMAVVKLVTDKKGNTSAEVTASNGFTGSYALNDFNSNEFLNWAKANTSSTEMALVK